MEYTCPRLHGYDQHHTLVFDTSNASYEEITEICLETEHVERKVKENVDTDAVIYGSSFYSMHQHTKSIVAPPVVLGDLYLKLVRECRSCKRYGYAIQLIIDVNHHCHIKERILNSEHLSFDNHYVIRNVYTFDQTEYIHTESGINADG